MDFPFPVFMPIFFTWFIVDISMPLPVAFSLRKLICCCKAFLFLWRTNFIFIFPFTLHRTSLTRFISRIYRKIVFGFRHFCFAVSYYLLQTDKAFMANCVYAWADMSCFQGLFFCPEAASLLLHNFCIYHISPPGHEVCESIKWTFPMVLLFLCFKIAFISLPWNAIVHIISSGISTRVLAVGSCCYLSGWACPFCWWLSRSGCWGSQPFWVSNSLIIH